MKNSSEYDRNSDQNLFIILRHFNQKNNEIKDLLYNILLTIDNKLFSRQTIHWVLAVIQILTEIFIFNSQIKIQGIDRR